MSDELKYLLDQMEKIVESPQNLRNKKFWKSQVWPKDMWRGFPRLRPSQSQNIPFLVFPDNVLWAKILKVDLREYYSILRLI